MADFFHTTNRSFIAIDTTSLKETEHLLKTFSGKVRGAKFGLENVLANGLGVLIPMAHAYMPGSKNFSDVKIHDIPNTVGGAIRAVMQHDIDMINIHASAGEEAIKAAAKEVAGTPVTLLGVTVLTSLDDKDCISIYGANRATKVLQFARLMAKFGGPGAGIVCGFQEVSLIQDDPETQRLITVVPGHRLPGDSKDDQKNIVTPGLSLQLGVNFDVFGRMVTNPPDGDLIAALARAEASYDEGQAARG